MYRPVSTGFRSLRPGQIATFRRLELARWQRALEQARRYREARRGGPHPPREDGSEDPCGLWDRDYEC